jgi:hypothetical protein
MQAKQLGSNRTLTFIELKEDKDTKHALAVFVHSAELQHGN